MYYIGRFLRNLNSDSLSMNWIFLLWIYCDFRSTSVYFHHTILYLINSLIFFGGGDLFRAAPTACISSWGQIGTTAPQPQQHQVRATSVIYTTAHCNTGPLTHWVRPGIKPETSWFLAGFVSAAPWRELRFGIFFLKVYFISAVGLICNWFYYFIFLSWVNGCWKIENWIINCLLIAVQNCDEFLLLDSIIPIPIQWQTDSFFIECQSSLNGLDVIGVTMLQCHS